VKRVCIESLFIFVLQMAGRRRRIKCRAAEKEERNEERRI